MRGILRLITGLALLLSLSTGLAACGEGDDGEQTPPTGEEQSQ